MKFKWTHLFAVLGIAAMLFAVGCADEDEDNNNNNNPPVDDPLVGDWNAYDGLTELGAEEFFIRFRDDSTYLFRSRDNATTSDETGHWTADADSIHFHMTAIDNVPTDSTYSWWYDFLPGEDSLRLRHVYDDVYEVRYARAQ